MGSVKKWVFNASFFLLIIGLTLYMMLHEENPVELLHLLDQANGWYWLIASVLVLLFISCESLILRLLLNDVGQPPKKGHCLIYSFIGFFFCCITPAAGGGQPAQVYFMHKDGLDPGTTTPILLLITIGYKLVLVILGLFAILVKPFEMYLKSNGAIYWCMAGWIVNVIAITFFALLIVYPEWVEKVCLNVLDFVSRFIKRDRWINKLRKKLDNSIESYHEVSRCIKNNNKLFILVILISILQRFILFSVTWLVFQSFGITQFPLIEVVLLQSMVSLGTDMLPLPGGSGAHEALFLLLFTSLCGEELVLPILIASRGISYYWQFIICGIMFLIFGIRLGKKKGSV